METLDKLAATRRTSNISSYGIIKGIMGSGVIDSLPLRVRCECDVAICEEIIEINLAKRRDIRRRYPRGFIIIPSHANTSQDISLCKTVKYHVVEKLQFTEIVQDL